jgi:hypothetical protein
MVLAAVHGAPMGVPQFLTVSVKVPADAPGAIVAVNCLTAALAALLTPGSAITIVTRSMNVARSNNRPRFEMCNFSPDIP